MSNYSRERFDVLVVGGGPAGIAAAVRAAESGARVGMVDENAAPGGQIWRGGSSEGSHSSEASNWLVRLKKAGVIELCGKRVFHHPEAGVLLAEGTDDVSELSYRNLVLATGARERFLPFPGWTLPNVIGAGGLQAMVKSGLSVHRKRVVVAGTGPLLLAVGAFLRKHGANVLMICEQASGAALARFGLALLRQPGKIVQGWQLKRELAGVPFAVNSWPVAAQGEEVLESVTISRRGKMQTIECDYLACGFHLVPNTELASLLGCRLEDGYVLVDDFHRTSVPNALCAGEPTGIGGVELSLIEGEIAGLAATERTAEARELFDERKKLSNFARSLEQTFRLRPELQDMPHPETIVCRCEDVPYARLRQYDSWRAAKLQTRCGMGPCQGRVCGPACGFLFNWSPDSVRPPIFPVRVESLAASRGASALVHE